jgi:hypothetical protein
MDRTNWKFGRFNINILTLGIAYLGVAFPILWVSLPKKGNSNTDERVSLIDRFLSLYGISKIKCLTADREFVGHHWFKYLLNQRIHFRIRIRDNFQITNARGIPVSAKSLFRKLKPGQRHLLRGRRMVLKHRLFVIGSVLPDGQYLLVVTNHAPYTAIKDYLQRWSIETLFGCLKSRGFNFESTHLKKLERIEKLMALLAIAFCWCHLSGEWLNSKKPIKIKKHGRLAVSIFRYGLDLLRETLLNTSFRSNVLKQLIQVFEERFLLPAESQLSAA